MIAGENNRAVGRYMVISDDVDAAEERTGDDTNQGEHQALHHFIMRYSPKDSASRSYQIYLTGLEAEQSLQTYCLARPIKSVIRFRAE